MTHRAGSPRLLLACERVTWTQRLTFAAAFGCGGLCHVVWVVGLGVGEALVVGFAVVGVGCAGALSRADGDACGGDVEAGVPGRAEPDAGVGTAEWGSVADCSMTAPPRPRPAPRPRLKVAPLGTLEATLGAGVTFGAGEPGAGVGVVVGSGVGGVGDGLGRGAGSLSGSQDVWLADELAVVPSATVAAT